MCFIIESNRNEIIASRSMDKNIHTRTYDILYIRRKKREKRNRLYEDAKENEMFVIRILFFFVPDLISLWNWWAFGWSWWNGWCWTTKTIQSNIYHLFLFKEIQHHSLVTNNNNNNEHSFSLRITYIGEIGGGKPPGCGLALPC